MNPYVDTNFLVALYLGITLEDDWQDAVHRLHNRPFAVTWLQRAEVCNAIQLYVFRTRTGGLPRVSSELAGAAWAQFREDLRAGKLGATDISSPHLVQQAESLSLKYTARHGFRAYDLLHVSSALILGCDLFWSFDVKASRLAALEGLKVRTQ